MVYHRSEGGGGRSRHHRHKEDDRYHSRSHGGEFPSGSRSWEGDGEGYRQWDNGPRGGYPESNEGRLPDRFIPPPPPPMFNHPTNNGVFRYQDSGQFNQQVSQHPLETFPHYSAERPEPPKSKQNVFQNDGSFLEMFKKMQDGKPPTVKVESPTVASSSGGTQEAATAAAVEPKKPTVALPMVGKRRGGRVLKTGLVKKLKIEKPEDKEPKNAWSMYMNEVRKYKEASCEEEGKTRPLVK